MPTGYTAPVEDGEITELKDFAANCARAFGAFIHQRDSTGRTLTYPTPPSEDDYEHRSLNEAQTALKNWLKASEEDKYAQWSESVERTAKSSEESKARNAELNARYDAMLFQVGEVEVPERLQSFKDFMIQQLTDSKYGPYKWLDEPHEDFFSWCDSHEKYLRRILSMRQESVAREEENYRDRVEYINLMRDTYGFEVEQP